MLLYFLVTNKTYALLLAWVKENEFEFYKQIQILDQEDLVVLDSVCEKFVTKTISLAKSIPCFSFNEQKNLSSFSLVDF